MSAHENHSHSEVSNLAKRLAESGLRLTSHRERVYHMLCAQTDHPTADEVYLRAKAKMPEISMATIYNTLDALLRCGLIKQVHVDRSATRYCCNMKAHCHFYCEECGGIFDIKLLGGIGDLPIRIPRDLTARQWDISIRGSCRHPDRCSRKS